MKAKERIVVFYEYETWQWQYETANLILAADDMFYANRSSAIRGARRFARKFVDPPEVVIEESK